MSEAPDGPRRKSDPAEEQRVHHPRRALPTDVVRPTRAEVQLSHLRHNLGVLRKAAGKTPIWAVLKADGYGHGAKAVARTLERAGVDGVCVALVEEGVELREAGIALPILVMGGYYGRAEAEFSHFHLTPVLSDRGQAESLAMALKAHDRKMVVHAKVDTGMGRLGTRPSEVPAFAAEIQKHSCLQMEGLMSHLANADMSDPGVLENPLALFAAAEAQFKAAGLHPTRRHMANSAGILRDNRTHFDLVRPGLSLFGVNPLANVPSELRPLVPPDARFKPTLRVMSHVVSLRTLSAGDAVGYGGRFVANGPTVVATVPMGYADGLSRMLGGRGFALVRGKRVPYAGNVSMDMIGLDVSAVEGVSVSDEVVLLGEQKGPLGTDAITPDELGTWSGTIPYEVLTSISRRVPRFYRES